MFEEHVEKHLSSLIMSRLKQANVELDQLALQSATWKDQSPFLGLKHFEFEHQAIYFGRSKATSDVVDRLKRQAASGSAFVLILINRN
jgi:hypothetical protein